MNKQWIVVTSVVAVVVAFMAGAVVFKGREAQQVSQAAQSNSDALVRASSPVFGNPAAKVTIVEFFDPACETCRAFYPLVKTMVNSSFGQVRLVVRHAPLHQGSDTAVKILEAARLQGQYWPAVERALAGQPQWAAHGNARPELIWDLITDLGLGELALHLRHAGASRRRQPRGGAAAGARHRRHEGIEGGQDAGVLRQWHAAA